MTAIVFLRTSTVLFFSFKLHRTKCHTHTHTHSISQNNEKTQQYWRSLWLTVFLLLLLLWSFLFFHDERFFFHLWNEKFHDNIHTTLHITHTHTIYKCHIKVQKWKIGEERRSEKGYFCFSSEEQEIILCQANGLSLTVGSIFRQRACFDRKQRNYGIYLCINWYCLLGNLILPAFERAFSFSVVFSSAPSANPSASDRCWPLLT